MGKKKYWKNIDKYYKSIDFEIVFEELIWLHKYPDYASRGIK